MIDVFRAFSLVPWALERGASKVVPVRTEAEALALRERHPDILIAGERDGKPLPGFDFGNSPAAIRDADLSGADLRGADIGQATADKARFVGADLTAARLDLTTLNQADLRGAKLVEADLSLADLTRANLAGTQLTGADLTEATLTDANWWRAIGLKPELIQDFKQKLRDLEKLLLLMLRLSPVK